MAALHEVEAKGLRGFFPGVHAHYPHNTSAASRVPAHGCSVAAVAVIGRVGDHPGAYGIEIDIGGHDGGSIEAVFGEDASEPLHPESAFAIIHPVVPGRKALFEDFFKFRDIAHAPDVLVPEEFGGMAALFEGFLETEVVMATFPVVDPESLEQLGIAEVDSAGHEDELMEMVAHDDIIEDFDAQELGDAPHEPDKEFLFLYPEEVMAPDDPRGAVIKGVFSLRGLDAGYAHGSKLPQGNPPAQQGQTVIFDYARF